MIIKYLIKDIHSIKNNICYHFLNELSHLNYYIKNSYNDIDIIYYFKKTLNRVKIYNAYDDVNFYPCDMTINMNCNIQFLIKIKKYIGL